MSPVERAAPETARVPDLQDTGQRRRRIWSRSTGSSAPSSRPGGRSGLRRFGRRGRRIGVNLLWMVPGVVGGSEDYVVALFRAFADAPGRDGLDITLFVNRRFVTAHPDLAERYRTVVAPVDGGKKGLRVLAESTWLVVAAKRSRIELMHHPGGTMPEVRVCPGVVTMHDLQPWAYPENFTKVKRAYLHAVVGRSVRHAQAVTTLSAWVGRDVVNRLKADPAKITVISPGVDPVVVAYDSHDRTVLDQYELSGPFFLYPAITYRHKNHAMLIEAFSAVVKAHPDITLVLTGGEGPCESEVSDLIDRLRISDSVRRTGRIPGPDLEALHRHATALTFPSLYEGFGMPVLDSMMCGQAVLASDICALPEVVGDGGMLLDPDDPAAWAAAMDRLLSDRAHLADLRLRSKQRGAEFEWKHAAEQLAITYRGRPVPTLLETAPDPAP